jgi:adenosylcobinamide amidohydrolase
MSTILLDQPWLSFDLGCEMHVLSWAVNRPGFVRAREIIWREVTNVDLPAKLDVRDWLTSELKDYGAIDAVAFLTSRDIRHFVERRAKVGQIEAHAVATVGLSNAERVGFRIDRNGQNWGTINIAVRLDYALSATGLLEAISIATQARTAAVMDTKFMLPTGIATGTGTDNIAIAAHDGLADYAGLHTGVGEAIGQAVYNAVQTGAEDWMNSNKITPGEKIHATT